MLHSFQHLNSLLYEDPNNVLLYIMVVLRLTILYLSIERIRTQLYNILNYLAVMIMAYIYIISPRIAINI